MEERAGRASAGTGPLADQSSAITHRHWRDPASVAKLTSFERSTVEDAWKPVGVAIPVSLGRSGLAWGRGLHPLPADARPAKGEGDGCAPAGVFALTALFGEAGEGSALAQSARLPYLCATHDLKCVDDPASRHYNRIVDQRTVTPDWASAEDMRRADTRYAIGAVIAHNAAPPLPGAGSCIFLHVWGGPGVPTAGCTAAALADVQAVCAWLDGALAPCLVQLPATEYAWRRDEWQLP